MKRNSTGFPSTMFIGVDCASNFHDIADLFAGYFQGGFVNDLSVENANEYDEGSGDPSVLSLIQLTEVTLMNLEEKKRPDPDGISPLMLKKIFLGVKAPLTFIFSLMLGSGVFLAL
jgi:hypothetical protein